ncbi:fibroblast growth factor-binding protein 1 [Pangasianodon hypophthalmus]|uniref:fibroblast growth factor-binding protein 1 n=1 Tax=Pangasianodon hypophthalmus TaxID=310915 RepID=UPI000F004963|nr:fibroblast growth factor-binding protein 1 [Pangasianodon hypophthalmus]XP_053091755.1 fibroblast growth factor-binding protein 1 [Pangasianodon hypophthalmus]
MAHLKGITLILICICIMQHFLQANAQAKKGRGRQKQHNLSPKPTIPLRNHKKSGSKDANDDGTLVKGRIENKDGTQCTWAATESGVEGDGAFVLSITCKNGTEKSLQCEYTAKPRLCPKYTSSVDEFWKQISRSLKKQKKLCRDSKALLKARMCRKAPRDAHFALKTTPKVHPTPERKNKPCPNLTNRQKLAEEYCSSSWSSVCTFFFAMVETEDC